MENPRRIEIGSRVRLLGKVDMPNISYEAGHEFTVTWHSFRGWDLIDDNGNKLEECLFIHDLLELI